MPDLAGQGAERWSGAQSGFAREENREEQMDPLFLGVRNLRVQPAGESILPNQPVLGTVMP